MSVREAVFHKIVSRFLPGCLSAPAGHPKAARVEGWKP
jgi:hypothetical protein